MIRSARFGRAFLRRMWVLGGRVHIRPWLGLLNSSPQGAEYEEATLRSAIQLRSPGLEQYEEDNRQRDDG